MHLYSFRDTHTKIPIQILFQIRHVFLEEETTGNPSLINAHVVVNHWTKFRITFYTQICFRIQISEGIDHASFPYTSNQFVKQNVAVFFNENVWISIDISLKFVPKGPINNIPALVQIMAWRRPGDTPLSEPIIGLNELTTATYVRRVFTRTGSTNQLHFPSVTWEHCDLYRIPSS